MVLKRSMILLRTYNWFVLKKKPCSSAWTGCSFMTLSCSVFIFTTCQLTKAIFRQCQQIVTATFLGLSCLSEQGMICSWAYVLLVLKKISFLRYEQDIVSFSFLSRSFRIITLRQLKKIVFFNTNNLYAFCQLLYVWKYAKIHRKRFAYHVFLTICMFLCFYALFGKCQTVYRNELPMATTRLG